MVSNLPGRIRLEAEGLSNLFEQRHELAEAMAAIPGVTRARVTPAAQSVLLEYSRGAGVEIAKLSSGKFQMTGYNVDVNGSSKSGTYRIYAR